ncbi:MAG: IS1634 family transposase, partial [Candidatus Eremiobacteraeota bacterium]|nr:IS1634 family transposase [Candidatus Eremiobacteraeota bacterium]
DHLGIVAGVCEEIGLAEYLDALAGPNEQQVRVGTATVAMILNGLGFSNRRLYLVSQFFATKPVEHLLGPGITADLLHDDCLGRTLDWLYDHDPTTLFAGIARQARQRFGVAARQVHVDTISFSVSGEYAPDPEGDEEEEDAQVVAVTYGYSRDHREDLKQWMLALATTRQGDIPLYLHALDGNASDKVSLVAAVEALGEQLHGEGETPLFVADSGMYSRENMARLNTAQVRWISRVPETSAEAKAAVGTADAAAWQQEGELSFTPVATAPQGERWVLGRTVQGVERTRATLARKAEQTRVEWEKTLWHLRAQRFACAPDAQAALTKQLTKLPEWLRVEAQLLAHPTHTRPGRPRKGTVPDGAVWQATADVALDPVALERVAQRQACFLVATNVVDPTVLSDQDLIQTYKEQTSVERGFAFLKDPLFLASSVFVKKPARIVALSLVMVLCLLVYRLAEHRLREQLAATGQTVPNQLSKSTDRPTMRWIFQCFEGISLLTFPQPGGPPQQAITELEPLHEQVLALLGPSYEKLYKLE